MIKVYISPFHDIYTNIALERYLFEVSQNDLLLFLWSNNPCIVMGRNQNIYDEVNLKYCQKEGIQIARRYSGGGSVYQDLGNLNYTFIAREDYQIEKLNKILVDTFKKLELEVYFNGRNDLLCQDKKFSGLAYCYDFNHLMYHGTCMIDVDKDKLTKALIPHDYKLKSHSVSSYKSRVINLKEIKNVSPSDIQEAFIQTLKELDEVELVKVELNDQVKREVEKLSNLDYVYNSSPDYQVELNLKLNHSNYRFLITYQEGIIKNLEIFTDDLDSSKKEHYISHLLNKKISLDQVEEYLKTI